MSATAPGASPLEPWRFAVWDIMSYAWTEIGITQDECDALVAHHGLGAIPLAEIRRVVYRDVCASFAHDTFLIFPLMAWMLMPDWGYDAAYLRRRAAAWEARPAWRHWLNPLRAFGYPMAVLFSASQWRMLRRAHAKARAPG
jgi:hypothetical protein